MLFFAGGYGASSPSCLKSQNQPLRKVNDFDTVVQMARDGLQVRVLSPSANPIFIIGSAFEGSNIN